MPRQKHLGVEFVGVARVPEGPYPGDPIKRRGVGLLDRGGRVLHNPAHRAPPKSPTCPALPAGRPSIWVSAAPM